MLKVGGDQLHERLSELMKRIWEEEEFTFLLYYDSIRNTAGMVKMARTTLLCRFFKLCYRYDLNTRLFKGI